MKRLVSSAIAGGLAVALLAGCSSPSSSTAGSSNDGTPVEGGTLIYSDVQTWPNVQTQKAPTYTIANLLNQVLDRLTYYDPETGELVPWLAEKFEANADSTEFTFTLRDGVTFSDGTPLDAGALKANLDLLGLGDESKQIVKNRDFIGYESSTIVDERTVTVKLSAPNAHFLYATAGVTAGLVSPSTLALDNAGQSGIDTIVGSGPFVYDSHVPDQEIVLVKRADYAWPPASASNQGAAYLDKVIFKTIPEVGLRAGALQSGQVNLARGIQPVDEFALEGAGYKLFPVQTPDLTANYAGIRIGNDVVSDRDVRYALQIGFDRQALLDTVASPSYVPAASVLNHEARGFVDLSADLAYDPDEANRLLDQAGWTRGADGIRVKNGQQLKVTIAASNQSVLVRQALEFIEQQWRELGVILDNRAGDNTFFLAANTDSSVTMQITRQFYYGGLGPLLSGANNNGTFYDDPELNKLFAEARTAPTDEAQIKAIEDIQRYLVVDQVYTLVLWDEVQVLAGDPNLHIDFTPGTAPIFQSAWFAAE